VAGGEQETGQEVLVAVTGGRTVLVRLRRVGRSASRGRGGAGVWAARWSRPGSLCSALREAGRRPGLGWAVSHVGRAWGV